MKSAIDQAPLTARGWRPTAHLEHFQDSYLPLVSFQRTKSSQLPIYKPLGQCRAPGPHEKVRRLKMVSATSAFYTSRDTSKTSFQYVAYCAPFFQRALITRVYAGYINVKECLIVRDPFNDEPTSVLCLKFNDLMMF